ncbi:hypothetical protein ACFU7Y_18285 [Kitasatospora sp. NPDC057542]|uniref:hypothetical protein n=1 Tax=Kitasatospora sp. NPDC057542 TaxID=3346162 RepID=UPI0036C70BCA
MQAERHAYLAALPTWGSNLETVWQGMSEEQLAESARLAEAERQAAHAVWADGFWATLSGEDRVAARSQLQHVDHRSEEQTAALDPRPHRRITMEGHPHPGHPSTNKIFRSVLALAIRARRPVVSGPQNRAVKSLLPLSPAPRRAGRDGLRSDLREQQ